MTTRLFSYVLSAAFALSSAAVAEDPALIAKVRVSHQTDFAQPVEIPVAADFNLVGPVRLISGEMAIDGQVTRGEGDAAAAKRWSGDADAAARMAAPGVLRFSLPAGYEVKTHVFRIHPGEGGDKMRVTTEGARLQFTEGGGAAAEYQVAPLEQPRGGRTFDASAFFPSLRTPAGVEVLDIQPSDHLHHFGLWWPWKHVEVDGKQHNTWEIQQGGGRMRCESTRLWSGPAAAVVHAANFTETGRRGSSETAVHQDARFVLWPSQDGARMLDIALADEAASGKKVVATPYRYSGFSIRGNAGWKSKNSSLLTSEGKSRDDGHSTTGRWLLITADADEGAGKVSVLMLSRAARLRGEPETFRLWDSKSHDGAIFANFNPVPKQPIEIPAAGEAALLRQYRLITADKEITAAQAEALWKAYAQPTRGEIERVK